MFLKSLLSFKFNPNRLYDPGPSKFWRRRRVFRLTAHLRGRNRNCYRLALRVLQKGLLYATRGRALKSNDMIRLYAQRVASASEENGINIAVLKRGLEGSNVCLNNHSLADLSIWEPRTFKALSNFAWNNFTSKGFGDIHHLGNPPEGVFLRGLKK